MRNFKNYCLALNPDENNKFQEVKKHYKTGQKKIFMSMLNAMFNKISIEKILPPTTRHEEE